MHQVTFIGTYIVNPTQSAEPPLTKLRQLTDVFSRLDNEILSSPKSRGGHALNRSTVTLDDPPSSLTDILCAVSPINELALTPRLWRIPEHEGEDTCDPLAARPTGKIHEYNLSLKPTGWALAYVPLCGVALVWHFALQMDYSVLRDRAADLHHYLADEIHRPEASTRNAALQSAVTRLQPRPELHPILYDLSPEDIHTILWLTHSTDINTSDLARLTARRSHYVQPEVIYSTVASDDGRVEACTHAGRLAITPGCTIACNIASRWSTSLLVAAITATCLAAQARSVYKMLSDDVLSTVLSHHELSPIKCRTRIPGSPVFATTGVTPNGDPIGSDVATRASQLANLELYAALIPSRLSIRPVIPIRLVSDYYTRLVGLLEVPALYEGAAALLERSRRALESVATEVEASIQKRAETRAQIVAALAGIIATLVVPAQLFLSYLGVNVRPFGQTNIDDPMVLIGLSAAALLAIAFVGIIAVVIYRGKTPQ